MDRVRDANVCDTAGAAGREGSRSGGDRRGGGVSAGGGGQVDAARRGLQINRSEQIMNDIFVAPA